MHAISKGHSSVSTEVFLHRSLRKPSLILTLKEEDPKTLKKTHAIAYNIILPHQ